MPSYRNLDGERIEIAPSRDTAITLFHAFLKARETLDDFERAQGAVPCYTGQHEPIDFFGEHLEALNRAVDALEDAVVASVKAAETPR
ncbi:MAG: hypothetical protein EOO77_08830 [Oxalobacteraceae bacterium]|nr:MAG: hypothetical protein EOO77_08830 [Oxalobacteraceae bacterium]